MVEYKGAAVFIDGAKQRYTTSFADHENGERVVLVGLAEDEEQHWGQQLGDQHDICIKAEMLSGTAARRGGYDRIYPRMKLASFVVGQDIAKRQDYPEYTATFVRVPGASGG